MTRTEIGDTGVALFVGLGFLLAATILELFAILSLNDRMLVYTLDDPYIHLALAENIMNGHYGVNSHEFSAPSSSILWPFLVAPFSSREYFPLLFNVFAAIGTVFVFGKIVNISIGSGGALFRDILASSILILLILSTNTIGLVFSGMEHSLQILTVVIIAYGLIVEIEKDSIEPWLPVALVAAPLIRYENLAVTIPAIGYLVMCRHYRNAAVVLLSLIVFMGGFSLFLISVGLGPLPTSVVAKSSVVESGAKPYFILRNLYDTLMDRRGVMLSIGAAGLLSYWFFANDIKKKRLALVGLLGLCMHFTAGRYGWFNRYEIYIWSFFLMIALYLSRPLIQRFFARSNQKTELVKLVMTLVVFAGIVNVNYWTNLLVLPIAANNIYEQQYQMHRFAVDFYAKPVAVNDLGYVSYKNRNYVLDLRGLASVDALSHWKKGHDAEWMKTLADKYDVELSMIYEDWFESIPDEWIKIGELHLSRLKITPARSRVSFFATRGDAYPKIVEKLRHFEKSLPRNVKFSFEINAVQGIAPRVPSGKSR